MMVCVWGGGGGGVRVNERGGGKETIQYEHFLHSG